MLVSELITLVLGMGGDGKSRSSVVRVKSSLDDQYIHLQSQDDQARIFSSQRSCDAADECLAYL